MVYAIIAQFFSHAHITTTLHCYAKIFEKKPDGRPPQSLILR